LEAAVVNPGQRVHELPILPEHQRQQILLRWNATDEPFPKRTIHDLFERQVDDSPDTLAVEFDNSGLTYADLNTHPNYVARHLRSLGAGPGVLIGLCIERSLDMVVALLGILKSGAAYIPLDPSYPEKRLQFVISDARPLLIVTQESLRSRFRDVGQVVMI